MENGSNKKNLSRPVAYQNEDFLNSSDARPLRILAEYLEPVAHFRRQQIRDTVAATTPAGYLGCSSGILDLDFTGRLSSVKLPVLVVCGENDPGTPASENKKLAGLVAGARYKEIPGMRPLPECRGARRLQPHHARLARSAETGELR